MEVHKERDIKRLHFLESSTSTEESDPKNLVDRYEGSTGHLGQSRLVRPVWYDCSHLVPWVARNYPSGHRYYCKMSLLQ